MRGDDLSGSGVMVLTGPKNLAAAPMSSVVVPRVQRTVMVSGSALSSSCACSSRGVFWMDMGTKLRVWSDSMSFSRARVRATIWRAEKGDVGGGGGSCGRRKMMVSDVRGRISVGFSSIDVRDCRSKLARVGSLGERLDRRLFESSWLREAWMMRVSSKSESSRKKREVAKRVEDVKSLATGVMRSS